MATCRNHRHSWRRGCQTRKANLREHPNIQLPTFRSASTQTMERLNAGDGKARGFRCATQGRDLPGDATLDGSPRREATACARAVRLPGPRGGALAECASERDLLTALQPFSIQQPTAQPWPAGEPKVFEGETLADGGGTVRRTPSRRWHRRPMALIAADAPAQGSVVMKERIQSKSGSKR